MRLPFASSAVQLLSVSPFLQKKERAMRLSLLPLTAILLAASPAAPTDFITLGAADVATATHSPLSVEIDPESVAMQLVGERLLIAPDTAALVKSRQEARALVALAIAYKPKPVLGGRRKPGAAEYVAALPLYLAAQGAEDRQNRASGNSYPSEWNEPSGPDPDAVRSHIRAAKQSRAVFAVHLLQKAGGCSGPMVDLLNRMRAKDSSSGAASPATNAGFARVALADLGRSVYPPDRSCE
jgi:hypothetical protein